MNEKTTGKSTYPKKGGSHEINNPRGTMRQAKTKIVSDALNEMAYKDDCQIVDARVIKRYSDNPRVEVEITELTPEVFAEWD